MILLGIEDLIWGLWVHFPYMLDVLLITWIWIHRWLSGSALKQVAVFGCPSTSRNDVFPAKRLRKFFEVPEDTVRHTMH